MLLFLKQIIISLLYCLTLKGIENILKKIEILYISNVEEDLVVSIAMCFEDQCLFKNFYCKKVPFFVFRMLPSIFRITTGT